MGGVCRQWLGAHGPRSLDDFSDLIGSTRTAVSASIPSDRKVGIEEQLFGLFC